MRFPFVILAAALCGTVGCSDPDVVHSLPEPKLQLDLGRAGDSMADLRQYVERFTGSDPLDCGQHLLTRQDRDTDSAISADSPILKVWVAAEASALKKSLECGTTAAAKRRSFWTFKQDIATDAWTVGGLLGTSEGAMYLFNYEDSCPARGCGGRIALQRCDRPAVTDSKDTGFRCMP